MSLGAVLGIFLSEFKKAAIYFGLLNADGNPVAGGGSSVEDWDAEVTTLSALNAAIADGARVLITSDITVSSTNQINLFSGRCTIGRKPECQIIQTGSAALFQLGFATTCDVTLVTVGEDSEKLPFIDTSGSTATYLASGDSGALIRLKGDVSIEANSGLTLRGVCALDLEGPAVTLVLPNGALNTGSASIRCGVLNAVGGGSSSYLVAALSTSASSSIESTRVTGSWRQVSSSPITEYALGFSGAVELGPVTGSLGALGYLFIDEGVVLRKPHIAQGGISARDANIFGGYTPSLQASTASSSTRSKSLFSGLVFDAWAYTNSKATYKNCRLPTSSPQTLGSGSNSDFEACIIPSALTLNNSSGSACRFRDCELDGTLVLDSGAAARVTGLRGSGTLTNNDPLSIVTGSDDVRRDTTPATRAFADSSGAQSATLNTELLPFIVGYWDGAEIPGQNRGPAVAGCRAGTLGDAKATKSIAVSGGKIDVNANGDGFIADISMQPAGREFMFGCYLTPDDATPASTNHILALDPSARAGAQLKPDGAIEMLVNGSTIGSSSTAVLSDGVESRLNFIRRNNAGTLTWYIYVDGVEVGAITGAALDIAEITQLRNSQIGLSLALPALYRRIMVADCAVSEATENLLDTYWLQGAGNA